MPSLKTYAEKTGTERRRRWSEVYEDVRGGRPMEASESDTIIGMAQAEAESLLASAQEQISIAQQQADDIVNGAHEQAESIINDAHEQAESIMQEARGADEKIKRAQNRAETLVRSAQAEAAAMVREAKGEAASIIREAQSKASIILKNAEKHPVLPAPDPHAPVSIAAYTGKLEDWDAPAHAIYMPSWSILSNIPGAPSGLDYDGWNNPNHRDPAFFFPLSELQYWNFHTSKVSVRDHILYFELGVPKVYPFNPPEKRQKWGIPEKPSISMSTFKDKLGRVFIHTSWNILPAFPNIQKAELDRMDPEYWDGRWQSEYTGSGLRYGSKTSGYDNHQCGPPGKYAFRVRAKNQVGWGPWSEIVSYLVKG